MTARNEFATRKGEARNRLLSMVRMSFLALAAFMAMLSTSHAASTGAYGGPLRQAAVLSSASNDAQAFLRFYNAGSFSATSSCLWRIPFLAKRWDSGRAPRPSPPGTAQQYPLYMIESALPKGTTLPKYYSVTVQSQFAGTFQYALWTPSKRTITNLSRCDSGITTVPTRVANVHSSILNA